jgi:hypothetical protein
MRVIQAVLTLLVIAITPFAIAGNKTGGSGGGHANFGGAKGGGRGGMAHQGNRGGFGGGGKHGQAGFQKGQAGGQGHQAMKTRGRGFSTKSTNGRVAFHGQGGGKAALHTRANGSFAPRAFHGQKYSSVAQAYHAQGRIFHDHTWWVTHYNRVVIAGGGWYYWDSGYWYPAWGYDPAAPAYVYDGPIYSYDNLPPNEVIMNVQSELEFQGYYTGPIDGQLGPQTQTAIAEFQRDHGLDVTSAVDYDTANSLGLLS